MRNNLVPTHFFTNQTAFVSAVQLAHDWRPPGFDSNDHEGNLLSGTLLTES